MICSKCGNQIDDGETYCAHCGTPVEKKDAFEPYGQGTYDNAEQPQEQQPVQPQYQQQGYVPPYQTYQQPFNNNFLAQEEISSARTLGILSIVLGILLSSIAGWICGGIGSSKVDKYLFSNDMQLRLSAQDAKKLNKIGLILTSVFFALKIIGIIAYFAILFGFMGMAGFDYYF